VVANRFDVFFASSIAPTPRIVYNAPGRTERCSAEVVCAPQPGAASTLSGFNSVAIPATTGFSSVH